MDIISPLTFKDDEWIRISEDSFYQNKRKSSIFKKPDGSIYDIYAFSKKPTSTLNPYYRAAYSIPKRKR